VGGLILLKMPQLKILNNKEIKQILKQIEQQWGAELKQDYAFLKNNKNRIFIINKDIEKIDLERLRINSIGLYFCEIDNGIRLSIEGSQIIGPKAEKNIVEITEEQVKQWLKGEDLEIKENNYSGFVIIKHKNDFLGTGKYKDGKVLNYVGKSRRVSII
jgi:NOL1/NOP2/fmu family ribosome biogenesis protein